MDAATRRLVRERANDRCEYCRLLQSAAPFLTFHVEHIHPRQHIDDDDPSNLCLACPHCNLRKGTNLVTLDLETRELVELFHPRTQSWDEHFEIRANGRIEGKTKIGEATVRLLKMNNPAQTDNRKKLIDRGLY